MGPYQALLDPVARRGPAAMSGSETGEPEAGPGVAPRATPAAAFAGCPVAPDGEVGDGDPPPYPPEDAGAQPPV